MKINEQNMPVMMNTTSRSRDFRAYSEGSRAFLADLPITSCTHAPGTRARIDFRDGWLSENRKLNPNIAVIPGTVVANYKYSVA